MSKQRITQPEKGTHLLRARDVYKIYQHPLQRSQEVCVLKDISIDVHEGEILGIVGPSGAGKSTLLHVLGGLDQPTRGSVMFRGKDLYRLTDRARARIRNEQIGFIFQFYHLLPEFTALENVILPVLVKQQSRMTQVIKEKGMELLGQVGLKDRAAHKPSEMSGGEQQRVAIARALVNQPSVLFCDEPTGNLDSENGQAIIQLLMRINEMHNQTIVVVTHDEEIAQRAARVIHLKDGEIVDRG